MMKHVSLLAVFFLWPTNYNLSVAWINQFIPSATMPTTPKVPPSNVKILILPGFGNDKEDYFLESAPEGSIVQSLQERGWNTDQEDQVRVLPVARSDWLRVFTRGALDAKFWANEAPPTRPAFRWYLDLVAQEVEDLCQGDENNRVVLLGHSAGGWLARAALGYGSCSGDNDETSNNNNQDNDVFELDLQKILGLVTLGSPHLPPPPSVMDMTRGALRLTHESFPATFHSPELFYITVMGQAVEGVKQEGQKPWEPTTVSGFAFNSYEAVCGDGTALGDGVVPVCAGHLEGAKQIDLPGVLHSINAPSQWYGSTEILDTWHATLLDSIYANNEPSGSGENSWSPTQLFSR